MSVVVGCATCGRVAQVPAARAARRCRCHAARRVLLSAAANRERWQRGVTLVEWFAAPHAPATRADCERGERPCPFLRCRYNLGFAGDRGCELDVAERGGLTLVQTAALLRLSRERVRQIQRDAITHARR